MQLEITIPNWEKYNSKRKNGHNPWFRLYNDLPRSNSIHGLPINAKWLFICLLCECSRLNRDSFEISTSLIRLLSELRPSSIRVSLNLLQGRSMLSWVSRDSCHPRIRYKNKNKNKNKNKRQRITETAVETASQLPATQDNSTNKSYQLIKLYCTAYKERYKTNPVIDGKTQGLVKNLLKATSLEHASNLIQVYLQMNDKWFITKHHDFVTFTQNLNMIQVAMSNGKETPKEGQIDWDKFWKDVGEKKIKGDKNAIRSISGSNTET